jgi:hypothetical protein
MSGTNSSMSFVNTRAETLAIVITEKMMFVGAYALTYIIFSTFCAQVLCRRLIVFYNPTG